MFHIVQPCANGPRRFEHATLISSHRTIDGAFDELERMTAILGAHGLAALASHLAVVTENRSLIPARVQASEPTDVAEPTRDATRIGRKPKSADVKAPPTEGWDFQEPVPAEHVALVPQKDGHLEIWRLEADGSFSRMSALEEALGEIPQVDQAALIEDAALFADFKPIAVQAASPAVRGTRPPARSFWSDCQVRIRWPKAVRPVKAASVPRRIPQLSSRAS